MNTAALPFASLPMYELPQTAAAWDRFWILTRTELAAREIEAEAELRRDSLHSALWRHPGLLLGQTCGWPLVSQLGEAVVPFARFDFGLPTARPGDYFSVFIRPHSPALARSCEPRDLASFLIEPIIRIAVNSLDSQSGFRVLGECLDAPRTIDRDRIVETGSHLASIRAIASGKAEIAAIDAVTWQLALDHEPAARKVSVVARSAHAPGLPLIASTSHAAKAPALCDAMTAALGRLGAADCAMLHLRGIVPAQRSDYEILRHPPFGRLGVA